METLIKMLNVFAWIAVIGCPLLIAVKIWLHTRYQDSLEQKIDNMNGVEGNYMGGVLTALIVFVVALVYLIVK